MQTNGGCFRSGMNSASILFWFCGGPRWKKARKQTLRLETKHPWAGVFFRYLKVNLPETNGNLRAVAGADQTRGNFVVGLASPTRTFGARQWSKELTWFLYNLVAYGCVHSWFANYIIHQNINSQHFFLHFWKFCEKHVRAAILEPKHGKLSIGIGPNWWGFVKGLPRHLLRSHIWRF